MRPAQAQQKLESILAKRGLHVEALDVASGLDAMLAFYRDVRADGCDLGADGDMLLYQWGTYDGGGRHFELGLTRQFIAGPGEDDDITQLSLTFVFAPSPPLDALKSSNRWCESLDGIDALRAFIVSSQAYVIAAASPILRVELRYGGV